MQQSDRPKLITWLSLLVSMMVIGWVAPVRSQVVPDTTLGNGNNSSVNVNGIRTDINGGLRRGSSLFHSFDRFNIPTNFQVYFGNPTGIRNIFSRVTGRDISTIDGVLGVSGAANLYFMNPNGIIFGSNARLDVSGSFFATTANAIEFPDNQRFASTSDRAVPLVEVNIPIGLQYGANPPTMLTNRGNLSAGKDLTLAAGNLDLQGQLQAGENLMLNATDTVKIRDTATESFVARSGGDMVIRGDRGVDILALHHPNITPFVSGGNLSLVSDGKISEDSHFESGGDFATRTLAGNPGNFVSLNDPVFIVAGNFAIGNYTGPSLKVEATGNITANTIFVDAPAPAATIPAADPDFVTLTDGRSLILRAGGNITTTGTITTTDLASTTPDNVILTATGSVAIGGTNLQNSILARSVTINTPSTVQMAGGINARLDAPGTAGNVRIGTITPPSSVSVGIISVRNSSAGNGGDIIVNTTGAFTTTGAFALDGSGYQVPDPVLNSALIVSLASEASNGQSGDISIIADGAITLAAGISSASNFNGRGGDINLTGTSINTTRGVISSNNDNAALTGGVGGDVRLTATAGNINAGSINATSRNNNNANRFSVINLTAIANPVDPANTTGSVFINQATLSTSNLGNYYAGDVKITAANQINITGNSTLRSDGYFGIVDVKTNGTNPNPDRQILIQNSRVTAAIPANTAVAAVAPFDSQITINSPRVTIDNSQINTEALAPAAQTRQANSGNISVQGNTVKIIRNSRFETITNDRVTGDSGNISIGNLATTSTVNLENSSFFTNANGQGNSGYIRVLANQITTLNGLIQTRTVDTNTNGIAGDVEIRANATSGQAIQLNNTGIDAAAFGIGGQTGSVTISAPNRGDVSLVGNSPILTRTFGNQPTGELQVFGGNILIDQYQLNAEVRASGVTGGNVLIDGTSVRVRNGSTISTETFGGRGGDITVRATTGDLTFAGGAIRTTVNAGASGNGGDITIANDGDQINFSNGFQVNAQTQATNTIGSAQTNGKGGNVSIVSGNQDIALTNSTITAGTTGTKNSGVVTFTGKNIALANSKISTSASNVGEAGKIDVTGRDIKLTASQIQASSTGAGGSGNVTVTGRDITLVRGVSRSEISTSAKDEKASAGNVTLDAIGHSVTLQNSDVIASSQGRSGNIQITGRRLDLQNGTIKAETGQSTGAPSGKIDLNLSFRLTLEDESEISTLGLNKADGGDITIRNVRFLFGKPHTGPNGSDIVGRADGGGRGGQVLLDRITLVQGFSFRRAKPGNRTNDIDTNGQLVNLSTNADVGARGLATPLVVFNDVSRVVASACEAVGVKATEGNAELKITGRGGVPISPSAPLPAQTPGNDWVTLELAPQVPVSISLPNGTTATLKPGEIYELQATCVNSWKLHQRSLL